MSPWSMAGVTVTDEVVVSYVWKEKEMKPESWVFTGTQAGMTVLQFTALELLAQQIRPVVLLHGDCIGADATAHSVGREAGARIIIHPAITARRAWCAGDGETRPADPLTRNRSMVDVILAAVETAPRCVAAPRLIVEELRSGTWATARYAAKKGVPVTVLWPDGRVEHDWKPAPKP